MELQGNTAIVTGAGQGIGKAIALAFAKEGADLVLAARSQEKLEEVARECQALGRKALPLGADVSKKGQVQALVEAAIKNFGKIDILVNNAGIAGPNAPVTEVKEEEWDEVLDINLKGTFLCSQAVLKEMIPRRSGRIINMSALGGIRGYPRRSPYSVSKWGINGFTQTLAMEAGPYNIQVNALCPGPVRGERLLRVFQREADATGTTLEKILGSFEARSPLRKIVTEEEVAQLAVFLASERSNGITGQVINIMAGFELSAI